MAIDRSVSEMAAYGNSAARGAVVTIAGQSVRVILQVAGVILLARLLDPTDYGLLAMATAIIGVGEIFRDFGLSSAAVQSKELSTQQRDNLFWLNSLAGLAVGCVVFSCAQLIGDIYHTDGIVPIVRFLSATFVLNGLATQHLAQLSRDLRFSRLAVAMTAGPAAGLGLSVVMALNGWGVYALVAQGIVGSFATLLAALLAGGWLPGVYDWNCKMQSFIRYGGNVLGVQALTYGSRNIDSIMLGLTVGPTYVGFYDRAFQLLMLPLNQLNAPSLKVALPVLSRLQDDPPAFNRFLLRGQCTLVHFTVSVMVVTAALAQPLIGLALGDGWSLTAAIFQILAIGGVAQALSYAVYWTFLAKALTRSNLKYALLTRPILIGAVVVGSHWGVIGVAVAYSASLMSFWPMGLAWIRRAAGVPSYDMFMNGIRATTGYFLCGVVCYVCSAELGARPILQLTVGVAVYLIAVALTCLLWRSFARDLIAAIKVVRRSRA